MSKFKHIPTGNIYEYKEGSKYLYSASVSVVGPIPHWAVVSSKDWEEIKEYPVGTKVQGKFYTYVKGKRGWGYPNNIERFTNKQIEPYIGTLYKLVDPTTEAVDVLIKKMEEKKPEWTILSFRHLGNGNLIELCSNNKYTFAPGWGRGGVYTVEEMLTNIRVDGGGQVSTTGYDIHSVRREKDKEVFTVEDTVDSPTTKGQTITKFYIGGGGKAIRVLMKLNDHHNSDFDLRLIEKPKLKEWEITAIRNKINNKIRQVNASEVGEKPSTDYEIYAIKRLSDGIEFKIGDLNEVALNRYKPITEINYEAGHMMADSENGGKMFWSEETIWLKTEEGSCQIQYGKKKEKLFTTEDGVDIYEGDKFFWINVINWTAEKSTAIVTDFKAVYAHPFFSTKEAAEEYILMNKPVLSLRDIVDSGLLFKDSGLFNHYKDLVKSKLK